MDKRYLFSSESVTEGHPDKLADQISDAVLDALLTGDPLSRVACETLLTTGLVLVAGEITTSTYVDIPSIVRRTLQRAGYTDPDFGIDGATCGVLISVHEQSPDIAQGVDTGGAGDQGMMFGFACTETPELMPMPIMLAHRLARQLSAVRRSGSPDYLRPDGKTQVTVEYEGYRPVRIDKIVVSAQHHPAIPQATIREDIIERVIKPIVPPELLDDKTKYFVNPTGSFTVGGPHGDTGLTGRKIIVDTYGGMGRHGGGAFSGKDPTKVDRSAAYMMRYIAKNVVAAGLADRCEIQVAYAIGEAEPMNVVVDTFGTGKVADERISALITRYFDLTPQAIIKHLDLRQPMYERTAAYGHFGRTDLDVPWERTDMAEMLRREAGL
ncbi:MAG: S-adenosylmethionine synthase [Armatimonadota bacterium]|nr:MAG: S-adenosylmethionine synthase [Armatimonadota bacterium]